MAHSHLVILSLTKIGGYLYNNSLPFFLSASFSPSIGVPSDSRLWSIEQVVRYFEGTADCADYADLFREQEVDGTALLLLTHESLVKCLGIKLGRALKIMVHVEDLRKIYENQIQ